MEELHVKCHSVFRFNGIVRDDMWEWEMPGRVTTTWGAKRCSGLIKPHVYLEDASQILVYNKMFQIDGYGAK